MTLEAQLGTIEEWKPADSVGRVLLADGTRLKLGASACKGFRPSTGLRVRVIAVAPHPLGGLRATSVELAEDAAVYDARVEQSEPELDDAAAAGSARMLGWLVVLLGTTPGAGRAGARALVQSSELARIGARVELGRGRSVGLGRRDFQMYIGRSALFDAVPHRGFVALSGGLIGFERDARLMQGAAAGDPWALDGTLRTLLRLTAALASVGTHVWRPVSGGVVPASQFREQVGDLDDASNRPIDTIIDVASADGFMRTVGMRMAGLPDVRARGERHASALRDAARWMAQSNRDLRSGERFASNGAEYQVVSAQSPDLLEIARAS